VVVLHWTYVVLAGVIVYLVVREMFDQKDWRTQLTLALVMIPLVLRILHVK
jgi:ABC-type phosphate transport system permease subunit